MRAIIKFTKGEKVKYISHLDILRLFQRAIMRAELPIAYSQGFNPHMLIGFACALPVGVTSQAEYAEIKLTQEMDGEALKQQLNDVLPGGIRVLNVKAVPDAGITLAATVCAARYEMAFDGEEDFTALCEQVMAMEEILIQKKSKKGMKNTNIRPMVRALSFSDHTLFCELNAGNEENLRPDVFWNYLKTLLPYEARMPRICRTAQLILQNGEVRDAADFEA